MVETLTQSLAPGGWLVLGDVSATPRPLALPGPAAAEIWERFARVAYGTVGPLIAAGLREPELRAYQSMLLDPAFRAWSFELTYAVGRRP